MGKKSKSKSKPKAATATEDETKSTQELFDARDDAAQQAWKRFNAINNCDNAERDATAAGLIDPNANGGCTS